MSTFQINGVDIREFSIVYATNEALPAIYNYGHPVDEDGNVIDPMFFYANDCVRDAAPLQDAILARYGVKIPVISDQEPEAKYEIVLGGVERAETADVSALPEPRPMHVIMQVRGNKLVFRYGCSEAMRNTGKALCRFLRECEGDISLADGFTKEISCLDIDYFPRAKGTNLRIVTTNIASTYNWGGYSEIELCHRKNIFLAEISALDPDVAAVQEADELWHEVLATLTDYEVVCPTVTILDGEVRANLTTLIYKKDKFREIASGMFPYTTCYDEKGTLMKYAFIRNMTWVVLEDKKTGARCMFTNTHWDWKQASYTDRRDGTEYRIYQDFQAKEQGTWTRELCEIYRCPAFGMGDFNAREFGSRSFPTYLECGGLSNARTTALMQGLMLNDIGSTHHAFKRMVQPPYKACDHIVYTPSRKIKLLAYRSVSENCLLDLSDHIPRYVDVRLSK